MAAKAPYYRGVRGSELLGDGQRPERIAAGIETVRRRATRAPAKEPA